VKKHPAIEADGGGRVHNQLLQLPRDRDSVLPYRSGVSLHGHTRHSQESLGFIATFLRRRTGARRWYANQQERCLQVTGIPLDLDRAYWTPPLCERLAQEVEAGQIEQMGLKPMVSLTDHNSIDACVLLREDPAFGDTPISTEWTVPFGRAVFHFGIHNLPSKAARSLMSAMHEATAKAEQSQIFGLFAEMSRIPDVLVVFNHPLWNFFDIPAEQFTYELTRFLEFGNRYIHAFELNGMRSHAENRGVLKLAAEWNQVLISGGDRHGCEPNAWLNLTNAADFSEFVSEVREGRQSTVVIMPQYAMPLCWRFYQNFTHVIADYPGHPEGRKRWDERTYHPDRGGAIAPMCTLWKNGAAPDFLKAVFGAALMATRVPLHGLLRRWKRKESESLQLPAPAAWKVANVGGGIRDAFGERAPEGSLEECLYRSGEPAGD
jgi:hypothetical protein